jgi:hypothetical protein
MTHSSDMGESAVSYSATYLRLINLEAKLASEMEARRFGSLRYSPRNEQI